jgi:hypothetical protein
MQDKADVLGLRVRLLWSSEAEGLKVPWIQFLERDDRQMLRSGNRPIFALDEAEVRLEQWLAFYNETGSRPPD